MDVQVKSMLSGLESAQLDMWMASHGTGVASVEIAPECVYVRSDHLLLTGKATATAPRRFGLLTEALNEAFARLRTEGGGS